jgi:hypothetical protein
MNIDEALVMAVEFAPGDGRGPEALHVLAREVERLRAEVGYTDTENQRIREINAHLREKLNGGA